MREDGQTIFRGLSAAHAFVNGSLRRLRIFDGVRHGGRIFHRLRCVNNSGTHTRAHALQSRARPRKYAAHTRPSPDHTPQKACRPMCAGEGVPSRRGVPGRAGGGWWKGSHSVRPFCSCTHHHTEPLRMAFARAVVPRIRLHHCRLGWPPLPCGPRWVQRAARTAASLSS